MKNASGLDEAGIDGGGIFREFLSELLKTGFDPNRGIFMLTASDDKMLYPNPQAPDVLENSEKHFFFLGRLLGKVCCRIYNLYNIHTSSIYMYVEHILPDTCFAFYVLSLPIYICYIYAHQSFRHFMKTC